MTFEAFLRRVAVPQPAAGAEAYPAASFARVAALRTSDGAAISGHEGACAALLVPPWRAHLARRGRGECLTSAEVATGAKALRAAAHCSWMGGARAPSEWERAVCRVVGTLLLFLQPCEVPIGKLPS